MMTLALCGLMLVAFLLQPSWELQPDLHEPLALVTSLACHKTGWHLVANLAPFLVLGFDLERSVRNKLALPLFCLSAGMLASVIEIALHWNFKGPMYGASGVVAALAGYFCRDWRRALVVAPIVASLFWDAFVARSPGVAHGAHIGGFLVGLAWMLLLEQKVAIAVPEKC